LETPLVLVVIPLYNAQPFFKDALDSILAQTYPNLQILIINDGSTDGCEKLVDDYTDKRIILWNQANQGPGAAMNRAIQYAREHKIEFIARQDADDISLPSRIEQEVTFLLSNPKAAACSTNCYYIDPDSEKKIGTSTISTNKHLVHWEIMHGLRGMIQPALLARSEKLCEVGGYRSTFAFAEETDLFLRLAAAYELVNIKEYSVKIRLNPGSLSMANVEKNISYQFYALDCAERRKKEQPENDYEQFLHQISGLTKFRIWRERTLLQLWRNYLRSKNAFLLLLGGFLDPRRVAIRLLRKILD
jgi:glycosyltransferase involved in cell wall biosynthesis